MAWWATISHYLSKQLRLEILIALHVYMLTGRMKNSLVTVDVKVLS